MKTYPEIIDYALSLKGVAQKKFVAAYTKTGKHALANVGYFSGYYSREKMAKIQRVFSASHPVFGKTIPTPTQAYRAGRTASKTRK